MMGIDMIRTITSPRLFGTSHKVAYPDRKHHCGWILGVTEGF
jgi:hypothetical protein